VVSDGSGAIEHGTNGPAGPTTWLRKHRFRIVLWVAVAEGLLAWATHGLHITTIVVLTVIAALSLALYRFTKERTSSPFVHEVVWLLAASQLGADVLVLAGYLLFGLLVILLVAFALAAIAVLWLERR
jgi:hypothetical protein